MSLELEYFYGNEAEQYSFYRIPKVLLTDHRYKGVSMEDKVLYGLMLDRMGLSIRSGWLDGDGRVYIYFTLEDAIAMLCCGKDKAVRLFKELDMDSGIGLIERRKQGQGKPPGSTSRSSRCRRPPILRKLPRLQRRLLKFQSLDFQKIPLS